MNPFDIVNDLSYSKVGLIGSENESDYNAFIINKAFSYFIDGVLYANELNGLAHLTPRAQHDYYLRSLRKSKRFSKWHKRIISEQVSCVAEYFQFSNAKASDAIRAMTQEQVEDIVEYVKKCRESKA
jgi:hypothetical protein